MPKFEAGDKVTVNGTVATITSWNDGGFFTAESGDERVGVTVHNGHTTSMNVELLAPPADEGSTLPELDGLTITGAAVGTVSDAGPVEGSAMTEDDDEVLPE